MAGKNDPQTSRARVFISYSRRDLAFVSALHGALRAAGYEAYLDTEDIAPGEAWRERLDGLILAADAVLFVITDSALASKVCSWEVERTLALGKRIAPMAHGPRTEPVPPALASLNWVFSDDPGMGRTTPETPTPTAIEKIGAAIDVDIDWVRAHSRLTHRAGDWAKADGADRDALLLRMGEVEKAKAWIERRPADDAPVVSEGLLAFIRASEAKELADLRKLRSITARAFARPAQDSLHELRLDKAVRLSAAGVVLSQDLDGELAPPVFQALLAAAAGATCAVLREDDDRVIAFDVSPDGARLATGTAAGRVSVWSLEGRLDAAWRVDDAVVGLRWTYGDRLLTAVRGGRVAAWTPTGRQEASHDFSHAVERFAGAADGRRVLVSLDDGSTRVWAPGEAKAGVVSENEVAAAVLAISPDGRHAAAAHFGAVQLIDLDTAKARAEEGMNQLLGVRTPLSVMKLRFSDDSAQLAIGVGSAMLSRHEQGFGLIVDVASMALRQVLPGHVATVSAVDFSPDSAHLVTGDLDGTLRLWRTADAELLKAVEGVHPRVVHGIDARSGGDGFVTSGEDGRVLLWDAELTEARPLAAVPVPRDEVRPTGVVRSLSAPASAVALDDHGAVHVLQAPVRGASLIPGETTLPEDVAVAPDGRLALVRYVDVVRVVDANVWTPAYEIRADEQLMSARFTPDSAVIVTASFDQTARTFDAATGAPRARFPHDQLVTEALPSPDGQLLATAADAVRLWRLDDGALAGRWLEGIDTKSLHFTADGGSLVVQTARALSVLRVSDGQVVADLGGDGSIIVSVAVSPVRPEVAVACHSGLLRVWRLDGPDARLIHDDAEAAAHSVAYAPDGRLAVGQYEQLQIIIVPGDGEPQMVTDSVSFSVDDVVFTADGLLLIARKSNGPAWVIDARFGACLAVLEAWFCRGAAFGPGGAYAVTASGIHANARRYDLARPRALVGSSEGALAASVARGLGRLAPDEIEDILMSEAPPDLAAAVRGFLTTQAAEDAERRSRALMLKR